MEAVVYPVSNCGVDYFGPCQVKNFRKTVNKLTCLFTCLSTSPVHPQIVSIVDTQSCLDAIHRFAARRGYPKKILSDKGTNFEGESREFRELFAGLKVTQVEEQAAKLGIKGTFNPADTPHFDRVREHLVRSCEKAMWNIVRSQSLEEEQLTTIVCSMEWNDC